MEFLIDILQIFLGIIIGAGIGFFLARKYMMNYMQKNPPINEDMIKTMMSQMGRTPNKKQINQVMKAMQKQYK